MNFFIIGEKAESCRRERNPFCRRADFRSCFGHKRRSGGKDNYPQAIEYGRLQAGKESGEIALSLSFHIWITYLYKCLVHSICCLECRLLQALQLRDL
jgi:hypothetical protein